MKYIKPFNESFENDIEIIRDIAESSFVYLLDEDFKMELTSPNFLNIPYTTLKVNIRLYNDEYGFTWDNIKDYYIPFLQRLQNDYKLKTTCYFDFYEPIPFQVPGVGIMKRSMEIPTSILLRDSVYTGSSENPAWWNSFRELSIKSILMSVENK